MSELSEYDWLIYIGRVPSRERVVTIAVLRLLEDSVHVPSGRVTEK